MKQYAGSTLNRRTKDELIEIIRCLEHNVKGLEEMNSRQFKLLIKKDMYAWHDLRKNPEDLPAVEERVVLTLDLVGEHRNVYGHRAKNGAWVVNGFETSIEVIAWRTDEPFEEDNE